MKLTDLTPFASLTQEEQYFAAMSFNRAKDYHNGRYDDGIIVIKIPSNMTIKVVKFLNTKLRENKIRACLDDTDMQKKEKHVVLQFMPEFKLLEKEIRKVVQDVTSSIIKLLKNNCVEKLTPITFLDIDVENCSLILYDEKATYVLEKHFVKKNICRNFHLHYVGSKIMATLD